jgi:hypothetical protein
VVGLEGKEMYTGTLIDDLISTVEQTQTRADERVRGEKLDYWYMLAQHELTQLQSNFAGVA